MYNKRVNLNECAQWGTNINSEGTKDRVALANSIRGMLDGEHSKTSALKLYAD